MHAAMVVCSSDVVSMLEHHSQKISTNQKLLKPITYRDQHQNAWCITRDCGGVLAFHP